MRLTLLSYALLLFTTSSDACLRVSPTDPGIPAVPCKTCEKNLLTVNKKGDTPLAQEMFSDDIADTGACSVRTLICKGKMAFIEFKNMAEVVGGDDDQAMPGTATSSVTCNAAGTAWEFHGITVTNVECSFVPASIDCAQDLIMATGMTSDQTTYTSGSAVRTFTCEGKMAQIEVTSSTGPLGPIGDGGTGTATYVVTCNQDGTGWTNGEAVITGVKCTSAPEQPCKTCARDLLTVYKEGETTTSQQMTNDQITIGACAVRTFTCTGMSSSFTIYDKDGVDFTIGDDGMPTVMLEVTCNADGTAWEYMNTPLSAIECSFVPPCRLCGDDTLPTFMGMGPPLSPPIDGCAERTFTCVGNGANVDVFTAAGFLMNIPADAAGTVVYKVTCNKAGTGWENGGKVITHLECKNAPVGNPCKACTKDMLNEMANPGTQGAKALASDVFDGTGACAEYTLVCAGPKAGLQFYNGNVMLTSLNENNDAMYSLVCNADGSAWTIPDNGQIVTGVQCTSIV